MSGYFIPKGFFMQQFLYFVERPYKEQKEYIDSLRLKTRSNQQLASFLALFKLTSNIPSFKTNQATIYFIDQEIERRSVEADMKRIKSIIKEKQMQKAQLTQKNEQLKLKKIKPFCLRCTLTKKASLIMIMFAFIIQLGVTYSLQNAEGSLFYSNAVAEGILGVAMLTIFVCRLKGLNTHDKHQQP